MIAFASSETVEGTQKILSGEWRDKDLSGKQ
jgi:hypothetical protein